MLLAIDGGVLLVVALIFGGLAALCWIFDAACNELASDDIENDYTVIEHEIEIVTGSKE